MPARAWVRATTCEPGAGRALWWDGSPPTLSWSLSRAHLPPGCASFEALEAVAGAAVGAWPQARRPGAEARCTGLATAYAGPTDATAVGALDGANVVVFRTRACSALAAADPCRGPPDTCGEKYACLTRGGCGNLYNCWEHESPTPELPDPAAVLALTVVTFDAATGRIAGADLELNAWNGSAEAPAGHYFTCTPVPPAAAAPACPGVPYGRTDCVYWDAGAVLTHEAGHMLGLDHVDPAVAAAVMNPALAPRRVDRRALLADDVDGICAAYPVGQAATRPDLGPCAGERRSCGCGGGPASSAWLLLPLLFRRGLWSRPKSRPGSESRSWSRPPG